MPATARSPVATGASRRGAVAARQHREARRRAFRPRLVREPRRPPAIAAALAVGWSVGVGLLVCAALSVAAWTVAAHGSATVDGALRAGGLLYLATLLAPVSLPDGSPFSLLPLGLMVLPVLLAYRAGRWAARVSDVRDVVGLARLSAVAAVLFAGATTVVAVASDLTGFGAAPVSAALRAVVVSGGALAVGAAREPRSWAQLRARVPAPFRDALVAASASVLALAVCGGVLLATALLLNLPRAADLTAQVAPGAPDGAALTVLGLLYLPTLLVWAIAYVSGAGVVIGGTAVSPLGGVPGVVPAFPPLAAVPTDAPGHVVLLLLLPLVAGGVGGAVLVRRAAGRRVRLAEPVMTAAVAGLACALLAGLARGSLGSGRLAVVGPHPLLVGLLVAAWVLAGAVVVIAASSLWSRWRAGRPQPRIVRPSLAVRVPVPVPAPHPDRAPALQPDRAPDPLPDRAPDPAQERDHVPAVTPPHSSPGGTAPPRPPGRRFEPGAAWRAVRSRLYHDGG